MKAGVVHLCCLKWANQLRVFRWSSGEAQVWNSLELGGSCWWICLVWLLLLVFFQRLKTSWNKEKSRWGIDNLMLWSVCLMSTCLLDVQLAGPDAGDELGGLGGGAVGLDQQVLVQVSHPAAGLQPGVGGRVRATALSSSRRVHLHQLLQGTGVGSLGDRGEVVSAGLLVPGHRTDGDRRRTYRKDRTFS